MKNSTFKLTALVSAALLSACGGGGGGGETAAPVVITPPVAALWYDAPVTVVPAAIYTVGSAELREFTALNEKRLQCGFGMLAQNTMLDKAADDHRKYLVEYQQPIMAAGLDLHLEYAQYPNGFTGATPWDRASFRGYTPFTSEAASFDPTESEKVRDLLSAPYHAAGMPAPYKDVGISVQTGTVDATTIELGKGDKEQISSSDVLSYPCEGVTGFKTKLLGEDPCPYSHRSLSPNPIGQSIVFIVSNRRLMLPAGRKCHVESVDVSMTEVATGAAVAMLLPQTTENDSNASPWLAFAAPDQPLKSLTKYRVTANVKTYDKLVPFDFTFFTGQ